MRERSTHPRRPLPLPRPQHLRRTTSRHHACAHLPFNPPVKRRDYTQSSRHGAGNKQAGGKRVKKTGSATDPLWYKDAIIYELHVRAFMDSNADCIGDFPGLLSKLDYLQNLGVTCLWMLPFFPSPLRADGYDIANYVD